MSILDHFDELSIGLIVERNGESWTIIRLVKDSTTIYLTPEGEHIIVKESFAQLFNEKGEIDFEIYDSTTTTTTLAGLALPAIFWRK